jgi:hypothetical protein
MTDPQFLYLMGVLWLIYSAAVGVKDDIFMWVSIGVFLFGLAHIGLAVWSQFAWILM